MTDEKDDEYTGGLLAAGDIVPTDDEYAAGGLLANDDDDYVVDFNSNHAEHVTVVHRDPYTNEVTSRDVDLATPELSEPEARELTESIRRTTSLLYILVKRAHAGKAHVALGYDTFEAYVKSEFDISRSWAYKLINQANVIEAVTAKVPEGTTVEITPGLAQDLRPVLGELVAEIEERTAGSDADEASALINQIMRERHEAQVAAAAEEAEQEYQGDYSGDYRGRDQDDYDDDDDDFGGADDDNEPVGPSVDTTIDAKFQRLFNLYTNLRVMSGVVVDIDELARYAPDDRRREFKEYIDVIVPALTSFREILESMQAEVDEDEDLDDEAYADE